MSLGLLFKKSLSSSESLWERRQHWIPFLLLRCSLLTFHIYAFLRARWKRGEDEVNGISTERAVHTTGQVFGCLVSFRLFAFLQHLKWRKYLHGPKKFCFVVFFVYFILFASGSNRHLLSILFIRRVVLLFYFFPDNWKNSTKNEENTRYFFLFS